MNQRIEKTMRCPHASIWLIGSLCMPPAAWASDRVEPQLDIVIAAHKAGREQLQSAHARIEVTTTLLGERQASSAEWWHQGDSFRVSVVHSATVPDGTVRTLFKREFGLHKGAARALTRNLKGGADSVTINDDESLATAGTNLWCAGLCCLQNRLGRFLEREFSDPQTLRNITVSRIGSAVRLTGQSKKTDKWYDVDLDPQRNYMVVRSAIRASDKKAEPVDVSEVIAAKEIAPGIFFPSKVTVKGLGVVQENVITFLTVNQPISETQFKVPITKNALVYDGERKVQYIAGENEEQASPEKVIRNRDPHPALVAELQKSSDSQSPNWTARLLGGAGVLAIALLVVRYRKVLQRPA